MADIRSRAAAAGGAYEFSRAASANLREADDFYNSAIAGFVGGAIAGLRGTSRETPMA